MYGPGQLATRLIFLGGSHTRRPSLQPGCRTGNSGHRAPEKPSSAEGCHHFRWIIRHNKPPAGPPAFSISPQQRVTCRISAGKQSRAHPSLSRARLRPAALVRYIAAQPSVGIDEGRWHTRWVSTQTEQEAPGSRGTRGAKQRRQAPWDSAAPSGWRWSTAEPSPSVEGDS